MGHARFHQPTFLQCDKRRMKGGPHHAEMVGETRL